MTLETLEALAYGDRDAALRTLVAGTEDHDAWSTLRHQHRGELDAADALLDAWPARHGRGERFETLRLRQLVLRADRDLDAHARPLAEALGYAFDHPRRTQEAAADVPSTFRLPSADALLRRGREADRGLAGLTDEGLRALPFADDDLRSHLQRLRWGGVDGLVDAVARDLRRPGSQGFGSLPVHRALALPELEALAARVPALRHDREWVLEHLARHRPGAHEDLDDDRVHDAWLATAWSLVADLPPALGGLRAHVLLHQLERDRRADMTDPARLRAWLAVPRRSPTAPAALLEGDPRRIVALGEDWSRWTGLPPVADDEPLVRHHLTARLLAGDPSDDWAALVDGAWLRRLEAEVRLTSGDPDAARWTPLLGATAAEALRARVDLAWCGALPITWPRHAPVVLEAWVKHAWPLTVRVFRVDVGAVFAAGGTEVPFDLDLDGLAARAEVVLHRDAPPLRRTRERIEVPGCDAPGAWLVELVGNGRASRALIRKGDLRAATRVTADGVEVTILDEAGAHRPEAVVWLGGVVYAPDGSGTVRLPFGEGRTVPALLVDGPLAVITTVTLPAETAALALTVALDRQALVPGRTARVLLRPQLAVAGVSAPLERLEDAWVEVTTLDRTGVPTTRREAVTLGSDAELGLDLAVPEHLASLGLAVGGRLRIRSRQRHDAVRADLAVSLAGQPDTTEPGALYVVPSPDGVRLRALGRSGEPLPRREVAVVLRHAWLRDGLAIALATDADGAIDLGPLPDVIGLEAHAPGCGALAVDLRPPPPPAPPSVVVAGETLRVPWRGRWRLVALRAGLPAEVVASGVAGDDALALTPPPGALRLEGDDRAVDLLSAPGPRTAHGALALPRATVTLVRPPPVLASVRVVADAVEIEVAGAGPDTRLHVFATPMLPWPLDLPERTVHPSSPTVRAHVPAACRRAAERALDEEVRYVHERRSGGRRVGVMLEKPSLLVAPWALRTTRTRTFGARAGAGFAGAPPPASAPAPKPGAPPPPRASVAAVAPMPQWDFLDDGPAVLSDLRPDADGRLRVPLEALPGAAITVVCVDPAGASRVVRPRPPTPLEVRDRRLRTALPAGVHLVETRRLSAAPGTGATARIDALEPLYRALCALSGDPTLAAWDFLPRWDTLTDDDKQRVWTEHGCHELALFVAHRDPAWFARALRPTLACRLEPDLVDDLLCGRPLDRWLVPWRLRRLDVVERALLARARPDARAGIARALADEVELTRPDPRLDDRLVDVLLGGSGESPPPPAEPAPALADALSVDDDAPLERARAASPRKKSAKADVAREEAAELWRAADLTKEWAEHRWHQTPLGGRGPHRLPPARLWRDLAAHGDGPFLSPHLADAATSFSAAVCALAVIGVPAAPLFATASLTPAAEPPTGTVLVGQHLVRPDDRLVVEGGEEREKHVGDELVAGVVYTAVVAVTNPTPRRRRLGVLVQIPEGTIALGGAVATRTTPIELAPWATTTLETSFYAPRPGPARWYGARVADGERVAAAAADRALTVVAVPTTTDADSWPWVSQDAPLAAVVAYLGRANLLRVDLADLAWRMRDRAAFDAITAALAARGAFDEVLWSHALWHRDRARTAELLDELPLAARVAPLATGLLSADAVDRGAREHLEYAPLINARAHRLGASLRVPNEGLDAHWRALLDDLAAKPAPTDDDRLRVATHLFAMDRTAEATEVLARVGPTRATLQRDWLRAYAAAIAGDLDAAAAGAAPHLDHPLPRWRGRFQAVAALVDEARHGARPAGDPDRRDDRLDALAGRAPALSARLDGDALAIASANLAEAVVRVHRMDAEIAFSRAPFPGAAADRVGTLEPAESFAVRLDPSGRTRVPLPEALARVDAVLEVVAGALRAAVPRLAHDLSVTVAASMGQVHVRRASTGAALAGAYVKVFGRRRGGAVAFFKDGYTDPRGRFDHATLSTDDLDHTERFAILVHHPDAGATVLEADPPAR